VGSIAERFNASQSDYKVVPVFKGNYDETLSAGIAAFRAGNPPHILQVFEVGTATMMAAGKAIKPVYEVMETGGQKFDPSVYIPSVSGYYTTSAGKMLSMPFNSSTTVFYYNKDAFRQAGLDPDKAPVTWADVARVPGLRRRCGGAAAFVGSLREDDAHALGRARGRAAALPRRRGGGAPQSQRQRREPVGDGRQEGGRVQGRGDVVQLPVVARD